GGGRGRSRRARGRRRPPAGPRAGSRGRSVESTCGRACPSHPAKGRWIARAARGVRPLRGVHFEVSDTSYGFVGDARFEVSRFEVSDTSYGSVGDADGARRGGGRV